LLPTGTTVNPGGTVNNSLLGNLTALKLNVRFDEVSASFSSSTVMLKDMIVAQGTFAGWTVQQIVDLGDQTLGGCVSTYTFNTVNTIVRNINSGYQGGTMNSGLLTCPPQGMAFEEGIVTHDEDGANLLVFPNPTRGWTTIELPAFKDDAALSITLLNATGAEVAVIANGMLEAGVAKRIEWDASVLPAGLYVCIAQVGDTVLRERIIVE
jgi:hypothetical protein